MKASCSLAELHRGAEKLWKWCDNFFDLLQLLLLPALVLLSSKSQTIENHNSISLSSRFISVYTIIFMCAPYGWAWECVKQERFNSLKMFTTGKEEQILKLGEILRMRCQAQGRLPNSVLITFIYYDLDYN